MRYKGEPCIYCAKPTLLFNAKSFCTFCSSSFFNIRSMEKASRLSLKNNNKISHFKKFLHYILNNNCTHNDISLYHKYLADNNIQHEDIFVVEAFLAENNKQYLNKYIFLNLNFECNMTKSEIIDQSVAIFQSFLTYISTYKVCHTIKYEFYITKIFDYLHIPFVMTKKSYKDNTKRSEDNLIWNKFIKYGFKNTEHFLIQSLHEEEYVHEEIVYEL